jgi:hypothetical protein
MPKQELTEDYLRDAFKAMDSLDEDVDTVNVADTNEAAAGLAAEEKAQSEEGNTVDVIDPNTKKEKEMEQSYVGYIVLDCDVCHSKIYKKAEDVKIDGETGKVNVDEECPFCMADGGFTICGKIAPCTADDVKKEQEETSTHKEPDGDEVEPEDNKDAEDDKEHNHQEPDGDEVEPKDNKDEKTYIASLSDEEKQQLANGTYGQDVEVGVSDIDDDTFSNLGEKYLKSIYSNVDSYKLTEGAIKGDSLILDGKIKFKSGKEQNTQFIFESRTVTKTGKVKLIGRNESLAKASKAFVLTGHMQDKKLMVESLTYNYSAKDADTNKVKKLYGTIKA